jgi:hypothetical protein
MAGAALGVNLVIDAAGDDLAESEQRLEHRNLVLHNGRPFGVQNLLHLGGVFGSHRFVWGSSEGADADVARRATENAEGLAEEDRAAILGENAQALQDGAYAEAWL